MNSRRSTAVVKTADVALLLEGTFPYVSGGVSSWINQMIRAFPDLSFSLVFLGSQRSDYGEKKYVLPDNVIHFEEHFLYETQSATDPTARRGDMSSFDKIKSIHQIFMNQASSVPSVSPSALFGHLAQEMKAGGKLPLEDFLHSELAWEQIRDRYHRHCTDPAFVDYFWTVRIMHAPLWVLAKVSHSLPPARVYHAISTGYAGLLGAMLSGMSARPLILSEHGIYTKERKIDLFKSEWIRDNRNAFQRDPAELSYFRQMWIRFFEWIGRLCYESADPIIALYEANRLRQVQDGALAERTFCIPNGVSLSRFSPLRALRPESPPPVLCLIGRVVPIKDVKNFIRAMRRVVNEFPGAEGWIAGPEDEDSAYADECRNLVASLGLEAHVQFLGFRKVDELMPKIGMTVLSSISEALPLVILEGYAAGVPTITTDVGSCRQLVEGLDADDRALGRSGRVVGIADPQALADAALELLRDPIAWKQASQAGIARVERYYADTMMFERYRAVYDEALSRTGPV